MNTSLTLLNTTLWSPYPRKQQYWLSQTVTPVRTLPRPLLAHPSRARQLSLHLCELPKTCLIPLSPFPCCPLGGVPMNAKSAPCHSPLSQSHQARGEGELCWHCPAEPRLNCRRWGCREEAEPGRRAMGSTVPSGQHRLPHQCLC